MNSRFVLQVEKFIVFYLWTGSGAAEGEIKGDPQFSGLSNMIGEEPFTDQQIIGKGTDKEMNQALSFDHVSFERPIRYPGGNDRWYLDMFGLYG